MAVARNIEDLLRAKNKGNTGIAGGTPAPQMNTTAGSTGYNPKTDPNLVFSGGKYQASESYKQAAAKSSKEYEAAAAKQGGSEAAKRQSGFISTWDQGDLPGYAKTSHASGSGYNYLPTSGSGGAAPGGGDPRLNDGIRGNARGASGGGAGALQGLAGAMGGGGGAISAGGGGAAGGTGGAASSGVSGAFGLAEGVPAGAGQAPFTPPTTPGYRYGLGMRAYPMDNPMLAALRQIY